MVEMSLDPEIGLIHGLHPTAPDDPGPQSDTGIAESAPLLTPAVGVGFLHTTEMITGICAFIS